MFIENILDRKSCYDCCKLRYFNGSFWCSGSHHLGNSVVMPYFCPEKAILSPNPALESDHNYRAKTKIEQGGSVISLYLRR